MATFVQINQCASNSFGDMYIFSGSMPGGPGIPENITVTFLNPTSVKVSWATSMDNVDKYDVTYKPTDARWVIVSIFIHSHSTH